jgi:LemA protein
MIILLAVIVFLVLFYIYIFNTLTSSRQGVSEAWSDIDVQLKRRHDLIPNLIDTVKGYATHEKSVFEQTAEIRTQAINSDPKDLSEKAAIENQLETSLHQILAIGENYPELKANENFLKLQDTLAETEDEIASSRRIYNDNVANYNTKIKTVPNNLIAKISQFEEASFF